VHRAFESRQTSDYADGSDPTAEEVLGYRADVETFVTACTTSIDEARRGERGSRD
jgi:uncharacterized protein (UPF0332 family)